MDEKAKLLAQYGELVEARVRNNRKQDRLEAERQRLNKTLCQLQDEAGAISGQTADIWDRLAALVPED